MKQCCRNCEGKYTDGKNVKIVKKFNKCFFFPENVLIKHQFSHLDTLYVVIKLKKKYVIGK